MIGGTRYHIEIMFMRIMYEFQNRKSLYTVMMSLKIIIVKLELKLRLID